MWMILKIASIPGLAGFVDKFDVIEKPGNRAFDSKIENSYSFFVTLA
ncbi:hypothetical protein HGG76_10050 [Ochrobactrum tritici]|uniref:Uncharacterized protein n=1 Tax=Brucella tritici TaxID=94626 RepID=A0A7X6FSZ4_9HYPH|nr:hypothetical protein [Brucella tritici]